MIEIDGIRRALEMPITEAGDYISDEWERMLDLATLPNRKNRDHIRLGSSIRRLNQNLGTTAVILGVWGSEDNNLRSIYDDVAEQVNGLIGGSVVSRMQKIEDNNDLPQYSGSFHWHD